MTFMNFNLQKSIWERIILSKKNNRIGSAYLFLGPNGSGKEATALKFSAYLNCNDGKLHPCGVCGSCFDGREDGGWVRGAAHGGWRLPCDVRCWLQCHRWQPWQQSVHSPCWRSHILVARSPSLQSCSLPKACFCTWTDHHRLQQQNHWRTWLCCDVR